MEQAWYTDDTEHWEYLDGDDETADDADSPCPHQHAGCALHCKSRCAAEMLEERERDE